VRGGAPRAGRFAVSVLGRDVRNDPLDFAICEVSGLGVVCSLGDGERIRVGMSEAICMMAPFISCLLVWTGDFVRLWITLVVVENSVLSLVGVLR